MKHNIKGFTLIELMITLVVVGILAAIAIPAYDKQVTKSRRNDAQGALMGFANAMERHYTTNNTYKGAAGTEASPTDTGSPWIFSSEAPVDGNTKHYDLKITAATDTSFTITATPKSSSPQDDDGLLQLDSAGARGWDKNNDGDVTDSGEDSWTN